MIICHKVTRVVTKNTDDTMVELLEIVMQYSYCPDQSTRSN